MAFAEIRDAFFSRTTDLGQQFDLSADTLLDLRIGADFELVVYFDGYLHPTLLMSSLFDRGIVATAQ